MAKRKKSISSTSSNAKVADYRHAGAKRTNIPTAKLEGEGKVPKVPKVKYYYSPHLDPELRFDPTGNADRIETLVRESVRRPLRADEAKLLEQATLQHEPWLEWAGKREREEKKYFEVDPVALHIHERVSAQAIIRTALRKDVQKDLFAYSRQPYSEAVQFYRHSMDWANRIILGDSLQVMSSLARREGLAGKVQMIYMDPPYGIKFASNFQPEVGNKDVKDKDSDLSREPEMVRAYRDTWSKGVHSYMTYMSARLISARELLAETGSIFVQIGDENIHRVRSLLDEVFGSQNFQAIITFRTSVPLKSVGLAGITNYVLWYTRNTERMKRFDLFTPRSAGEGGIYTTVEEPSGHRRPMTPEERQDPAMVTEGLVFGTDNLVSSGFTPTCTFDVEFEDTRYSPTSGKSWKTNREGMGRLIAAHRVNASGKTLRAMMYIQDYPVYKLSNLWTDVKGETDKVYVVQTPSKVIQRCLLMTTQPGDLVLDPTCGSGTTAFIAEQFGRRWVTIDTSRVAVAIARQRLISQAVFDMFRVVGGSADPAAGFVCKTVPHVTLKSIAQNGNLDPLFAKYAAMLDNHLGQCNSALKSVTESLRGVLNKKLHDQEAKLGKRGVSEADIRRWQLPQKRFEHWTVPFDVDREWPKALQDAVTGYREVWRAKMDEVNACIAANAEQEELVDQPEVVKGVVRVAGPFTVEGVKPEELCMGDDGLFDSTPNEFEEIGVAAGLPDPQNLQAYLTQMVQYLRGDGVTFIGNKTRRLGRLDALLDADAGSVIHAEGIWEGTDAAETNNIAFSFGPQYGPVTALQVEEAIRGSRRYSELVIAGFSFDAEASAVIQESKHPKLIIHQAYIRPDINPGMEGLLKETGNSQLFTVFGQPEVKVKKAKGDEWIVTLKGVDIYDPVKNEIQSTGAEKVAAWFIDGDYDGRCFCITQAFFPDQDAWEKIAKALGSEADAEAFEAFKGTESLPFPAGKHKRIAVKVIDPRGNEVMAIKKLDG